MSISSSANPHIKAIRALNNRQGREKSGLFFVEGIRLVAEAIQCKATIETLVIAPDLLKSHFAHELIQGTPQLEVSAEIFRSLSLKDGPQGIGAVIHQRWDALKRFHVSSTDCWIALDAAQDPGNIGTILRTADAIGATGLMLLGNCADPYDPGALRASMGAIFSQRLIKTSFAEFVQWKNSQHISVVGTSGTASCDYRHITYPCPLVLLMGSEREGLSSTQQAICDTMVHIPMVGRSDSLNLAVATGVVLYELFYQRQTSHPQE